MSAAENISRHVRRLREARGWTQEEAGRRLGDFTGRPWSKASWSAAEARTRPYDWPADKVAAVAALFRVPVGDLFAKTLPCVACDGEPPAGFTCNECGAGR